MSNISSIPTTAQGAQIDSNSLLKFLVENYNIDLAEVQEQKEMKEKQKILEQHPFDIWWCASECRWCTYYIGEKGKRKGKRLKSREKLENFLVKLYTEAKKSLTVEDVFNEWLERKYANKTIELNTKQRYERQYQQVLANFGKKQIRSINEVDIEDCIYQAINEKSLTKKGLANTKTILNGIFDYSRKQGYTNLRIREIISDMEISSKSLRSTYHSDTELVFTEDEFANFEKYINERQETNKLDLKDLGLFLLFYTGLRPGELAALERVADVNDGILHVRRTEIRYLQGNKYQYEVRDFPKTEAGIRDVVVPTEAQWILKAIQELNPTGKYLFETNGKRIKTCCFDSRLEGICKKIGIANRKSMNKIRKTNASMLRDNNVPDSMVIAQLGHTSIDTTNQYYYKDRNSMEKRRKFLDTAFAS